MRIGFLWFLAIVVALLQAGLAPAQAQSALTGQVSSADESAMEGVLVSAKKVGSAVTVTVSESGPTSSFALTVTVSEPVNSTPFS